MSRSHSVCVVAKNGPLLISPRLEIYVLHMTVIMEAFPRVYLIQI
jgi:hypothetical protein